MTYHPSPRTTGDQKAVMSHPIVQCSEQHRAAAAVLQWLQEEFLASGCGFWANRQVIEGYSLSNMFVIISLEEPIGFVSLAENGIDLFSIRAPHQRRGVGRELASFAIQELWNRGHQAITILCSPSESFNFWRTLRFEIVDPTSTL